MQQKTQSCSLAIGPDKMETRAKCNRSSMMGARAKRFAVRADTLSLVPPPLADGESLFWECNDLRLVIKSASVVAIAMSLPSSCVFYCPYTTTFLSFSLCLCCALKPTPPHRQRKCNSKRSRKKLDCVLKNYFAKRFT